VATNHLSIDWNPSSYARSSVDIYAGSNVLRAAATIRCTQDTYPKELPQLQLHLLQTIPKDEMQSVLYVLSVDQIKAKTQKP